jgi:hypothetical protein
VDIEITEERVSGAQPVEFLSEWSNGNAERLGGGEKAVIVGCEFDRPTAPQ